MKNLEPRIRASVLEGLEGLLRQRYNLQLSDFLNEVGIKSVSASGSGDIPLRKFAELLELCADRTGDDCFGLHFAEAFPVGGSGILGYLMLNAPDLRTFVDCMIRYTRLMLDALQVEFEESDGVATLTWCYAASFLAPRKQLTEFGMTLFILRARLLFGSDWYPLSAEFNFRQPNDVGEYNRIFGRGLEFGKSANRLTARSDILARKSQSADTRLYEILKSSAESVLKKLSPSQDIVARIDELIVENISVRGVDLEWTAEAVGLTPRQLQNELRHRDTTFEKELARVRSRLAERYLRETDLPMTEIALLLGFSELSSFTRAARSWFGQAPTTFRQAVRTGTTE